MSSKALITFSVLGASLMWGLWAFYVNYHEDNLTEALRTAAVQAVYSGAMTLYMSLAVVFFARRTSSWPIPYLWPVLFTVGHTGILLILIHWINHTQNLAKTVAAPLVVSIIYCFVITKTHYQKASKK